MNRLLKNGTLVMPGRDPVEADLLLAGGRILAQSPGLSEEYALQLLREQSALQAESPELEILDLTGLHVFPGLVDAHCHLRDPGQEYREDIVSGTRSAAAGGFTDVACMPNTVPVLDNKAVVRYVVEKAAREGAVRVHPIGAVTKGSNGSELAEMGLMKEAGIVAVSDDGRPVSDAAVMLKAMSYAAQFGLTVISHCEDMSLAEGGAMNEGVVSTRLGLRGIPTAAEDLMVSREIILSEYAGIPVHLAHVSTATAVRMIRQAKARGVKVTAETCPHYFTLTEDACLGYDTNAKMNPPLRTQADVEAVIEGLRDGTLDMIATDHAPHHQDEKLVEFDKANNGILGFETALGLALTHLVEPGHLSLSQLAERMSAAPCKLLGLPLKRLEAGDAADLTVVDTRMAWTVDRNLLVSRSRNTPYHGWKLRGRAVMTFVNGRLVARDGRPTST
jgi:dihydroorotase